MPSPTRGGYCLGVCPACPQRVSLPPLRRRAGSVCPAPLHRSAARRGALCAPVCPPPLGAGIVSGSALPALSGSPCPRSGSAPGGSCRPPATPAPVHICSHFVHIYPHFKPLKIFFRFFSQPPPGLFFSEKNRRPARTYVRAEKIVAPRAGVILLFRLF